MIANLRVNRDDRLKAAAKEMAAKAGADEAANRLTETESRLKNAQHELLEANDRVTKLESRTKDRRLTESQKETLVASLKDLPKKPKIFIAAGLLDAESMAFGEDIEDALIAAGFEVHFPKEMTVDAALTVGPPGLHLVLKDPTARNALAVAIQKSFTSTGFTIPGLRSSDSNFPADRIEISIGQK